MRTATDLTVSLLLAIFVAATVILIGTVPALYVVSRQSTAAARSAIATLAARDLAGIPASQRPASIPAVESRYRVRIHVAPGGVAQTREPNTEYRNVGHQIIEVEFEDNLDAPRRTFRFAVVAGAAALIVGLALLIRNFIVLLRAPATRVTELEALPSGSGGGTANLISTFETSIRDLKGRESELKRLHAVEKQRANDLAALTATLTRSLTSGFIAVDEHGLLVDANEQARDLLGIPAVAGLAKRPIASALGNTPLGRTLIEAAEKRLALQRNEVADEQRGNVIGLTTVPLSDEHNRYFGMLALFTDLTPLRRLEFQVREMQSLADLGEMSAGIAHEFRNSLSTIVGYLRLARKSSGQQEIEERLRRAEDEARLLTSAVESLLSFARPFDLQKQTVNPVEIIREMAAPLEQLHGFTVEFRGEDFSIDGDPALLRRAFENVLRNATEAMAVVDRAGHLVIEGRNGSSPTITVSDNGIGLDPADAARLFLPFRSNKPNGFGLGLALTKKIILLHGGLIRLTGRPDAGATVVMEFPPAA
ncbi:MAG: sensor histidine kinase [Thermoanaerobaculia bacterium]